jgi:hypothetical protein
MAGYAVSARLGRVEPRRVEWPGAPDPDVGRAVATASAASAAMGGPESVDLAGEPYLRTLSDWVAGLGEAWSQMVFFLFDPESWRT